MPLFFEQIRSDDVHFVRINPCKLSLRTLFSLKQLLVSYVVLRKTAFIDSLLVFPLLVENEKFRTQRINHDGFGRARQNTNSE